MNPALTIAKKEYALSLRSLGTYIIFGIFLLAAGAWFGLKAMRVGLAELRGTFSVMHLLFLFYIPAITMGSIAKERSSGTLELLSTLPIRTGNIIWGKFLAAWLLLGTVLLFTLVFVVLLGIFGMGADYGAMATGYLGLMLAGAACIGIGLFASSLTQNQIVAFITALAISGFFYLLGKVGDFLPLPLFNKLEFLGFDYHLEDFLKGVLDTRDVIYFAVVTYVFALLAGLRLQGQNLRQER